MVVLLVAVTLLAVLTLLVAVTVLAVLTLVVAVRVVLVVVQQKFKSKQRFYLL